MHLYASGTLLQPGSWASATRSRQPFSARWHNRDTIETIESSPIFKSMYINIHNIIFRESSHYLLLLCWRLDLDWFELKLPMLLVHFHTEEFIKRNYLPSPNIGNINVHWRCYNWRTLDARGETSGEREAQISCIISYCQATQSCCN